MFHCFLVFSSFLYDHKRLVLHTLQKVHERCRYREQRDNGGKTENETSIETTNQKCNVPPSCGVRTNPSRECTPERFVSLGADVRLSRIVRAIPALGLIETTTRFEGIYKDIKNQIYCDCPWRHQAAFLNSVLRGVPWCFT